VISPRALTALLIIAVTGFASAALANDSSALLEAGGIVLTQSADVTMVSEDLTISRSKVRVAYQFKNTSDKDVRTRVAFPVPPIPVCTEEASGNCDGDMQIANGPNPMQFRLWVDGKPMRFETDSKTTMGKDGVGSKSITHHWEQVFPAQKTVAIAHEYVPVAGGWFTSDNPGFDREMTESYCVGPKLLKALVRDEQFIWAVHYILTTGANWKGPIGSFKLTLVKDNPGDKVSVCLPDTRRATPTTFEVVRSNFVPDKDLKILFVPAPEPKEKPSPRP
jgi:hypothetical protein